MERVYGCCCGGVDVHKKLIVACLRKGTSEELREYGATTGELLKLADWLAGNGCKWQPWRVRHHTGSRCIMSWKHRDLE